jgi:hypothetical protein
MKKELKVLYIERSSEPRWPRVMRALPRGKGRSVDRGKCRLGMEPRNRVVRDADTVEAVEGSTSVRASASARTVPRGRETPSMQGIFMHENREIHELPARDGVAGRVGKAEAVIRR